MLCAAFESIFDRMRFVLGRTWTPGEEGYEITANGGGGIEIANGEQNTARRNSISANEGIGIANVGGSRIPAPPVIAAVVAVAARRVEGTACGGCVIELFNDGADEGRLYEGSAVATASGAFAIDTQGILRGPFLTATATDAAGTTSSFSAAAEAIPVPPRRRTVRR